LIYLEDKIFLAGHKGMVGSSILKLLKDQGFKNILILPRKELDLLNRANVEAFLKSEKPRIVITAAAKVGGIYANDNFPAEFIHENLTIQNNIIHGAYLANVEKLIFLGSSCIYPKLSSQPMSEDILLSGQLEPTNEPYAIAKIAGIKMCESYNRQYGCDFRSLMPTNLYGPNDNFDTKNAHVIPAMLYKFHNAKINKLKSVEIWGTGKPKREFLHVDDLASAVLYILGLEKESYQMNTKPMTSHINVGSGNEIMISELAEIIMDVVGFKGEILFNTEMPDGTPRKLLDTSLINKMGWRSSIELEDGLHSTYDWLCSNLESIRS
tara:strand:+ start:6408 stop:7379 length:972 start_codon:yes stop_codon:yes gene_type:complete